MSMKYNMSEFMCCIEASSCSANIIGVDADKSPVEASRSEAEAVLFVGCYFEGSDRNSDVLQRQDRVRNREAFKAPAAGRLNSAAYSICRGVIRRKSSGKSSLGAGFSGKFTSSSRNENVSQSHRIRCSVISRALLVIDAQYSRKPAPISQAMLV